MPSVRGRWRQHFAIEEQPVSPWDQQKDNVTATGTTDRCAGVSSLPVPVMAVPTVLEKSLPEFIKQGPILREIQRGLADLSSYVGDLERKKAVLLM